jgi:hypothetical protein
MALLVADHVDHIGGIGTIEDGEPFRDPQRAGVAAEGPVCDRMERTAHHAARRGCRAAVEPGCTHERRGPRDHLARRPPGERQKEEPLGQRARREEPGDPGGERGGLAGAGAGEDPERTALMGHGTPLRIREMVEPAEHSFDDTAHPAAAGGGRPPTCSAASRSR